MAITFDITYDASWDTIANGGRFADQAAVDAMDAVVAQICGDFNTWFDSTGTVKWGLGYGKTADGFDLQGAGNPSHNQPTFDAVSYSTIKTLYNTIATATGDTVKSTMVTNFPASDPAPAGPAWMINSGLHAIMTNSVDTGRCYIPISNDYSWDTNLDRTVCAGGELKAYAVYMHELTQGWGRNSYVNTAFPFAATRYVPLDLCGYSGVGTLLFYQNGGRYFSWDNGTTSLGTANTSGDPGDFDGSINPTSPFAHTINYGAAPQLRQPKDFEWFAAIGFPMSAAGLALAGIATSAPVNTVVPVISGTVKRGSALTCSTGTWSNTPTSYTYQWQSAGSNIGTNSSSSPALSLSDVGNEITCTVTATNAAGSASTTSAYVVVAAQLKYAVQL